MIRKRSKPHKVPRGLEMWLIPEYLTRLNRTVEGLVPTWGVSRHDLFDGNSKLFGEPETSAVEDAIIKVKTTHRRVKSLEDQLRLARDNHVIAIEDYEEIITLFEKYQETGVWDDRLKPTMATAIKQALAKDRQAAARHLKKRGLPTPVYLAVRDLQWKISKARVNEHFKYITIACPRENPLTEVELQRQADQILSALENSTAFGPQSERVARAIVAGRANIEILWENTEKPKIEDEPTFDTRAAMIEATGEFEVADTDNTFANCETTIKEA